MSVNRNYLQSGDDESLRVRFPFVSIMHDSIIKYYQQLQTETDDDRIFRELETLFKTSRTPEKSLQKKKDDEIENYIKTIQSDLLVQQLYRQSIPVDNEPTEEETKQLNFYRQKLSDIGKQKQYIEKKIKSIIEAIALLRVQEDTNEMFLKIENGEEI